MVEVSAYESRCPDTIDPTAWQALKDHHVDAITFASSKTVINFCRLVEGAIAADQIPINGKDPISALLQGICIASIGPQTSETCQKYLHRFDMEATPYTLDGLAQSLVRWFVRDGIPGIKLNSIAPIGGSRTPPHLPQNGTTSRGVCLKFSPSAQLLAALCNKGHF